MPKSPVGRTFRVAISLLAVVGAAQFGVILWRGVAPAPAVTVSAPAPEAPAVIPPAPAVVEPAPPVKAEQEIVAAEAERQFLANLPRPTPVPIRRETPLSRVGTLVNLAKALRERGDMSTALTRLREAQVIAPRDSQIISEMAITYEKMGLNEKAIDQWRRIYEMGEQAGIYYAAAEAKLQAFQLPPAPQEAPEPFFPGGLLGEGAAPPLSLGKVGTTDDTGNIQPLRQLKLRIPIAARPGVQIDVHDVVIQVYFYDQLGDGTLVETNADVSSSWVPRTLPDGEQALTDWSGSEPEVLQVEYAQTPPPPAMAKGKVSHERRNYFGYVVRVYYKGVLNASQAEPAKLLQQFPPPPTLQTTDLPQ